MSTIPQFLKELHKESKTTRKMLSIVPAGQFDWKPHPRSMTIRQLATHIAELPSWIEMILNTTGLDFQKNPYQAATIHSSEELLAYYEKNLQAGIAALEGAKEVQLEEMWTLANGDYLISKETKEEFIRMSYCQTVHHRAQLGVFLRLLDIPIPGSYGPSADEN